MAKYTQTVQHDYMRFAVMFPNGTELKANFSRNGHSMSLKPYDGETARMVATVFSNMERLMTENFNLEHAFRIAKEQASSASHIEAFVFGFAAGVKAATGIDISRPRELPVRERTTAVIGKRGRWPEVSVKFENGEDFAISFAGKSVGHVMSPALPIIPDHFATMMFGMMNVFSAAELCEKVREAAEAAPDIETMVENFKNGFKSSPSPSAAPRR